MNQDELLNLNDEIYDLEETYVELKMNYEKKKADLLLNTDFGIAIGKAKPTVAEKDAFVKLNCLKEEEDYKLCGMQIGNKKRELEIKLKVCGDD